MHAASFLASSRPQKISPAGRWSLMSPIAIALSFQERALPAVVHGRLDLNIGSGILECMSEPADNDGDLETASRDLARAIWQTVLLARDEHKARGLLGKATRARLVEKILKL